MNLSASRRTWEEASSPAAVRLARKYEQEWRDSEPLGKKPDLREFLNDAGTAVDGPGARLAILRTDMALRWDVGEKVGAQWYLDRYHDLGEDTIVALIYEEFCLKEEDQEHPDPAEFLARFPRLPCHSGGCSRSTSSSVRGRPRRRFRVRRRPTGRQRLPDERFPKPERRSPTLCSWKSWVAGRSRGSSWRRSASWRIARWRSRYRGAARASRRRWRGFSTLTSYRCTRTGSTRRAGFICCACPISGGSPCRACWPTPRFKPRIRAPSWPKRSIGSTPPANCRWAARPAGWSFRAGLTRGRSPGGVPGWPRRSPTPTTGACSTAISSRRTCWSPPTACPCSLTSTWHASPCSRTERPPIRPPWGGRSTTWRRNISKALGEPSSHVGRRPGGYLRPGRVALRGRHRPASRSRRRAAARRSSRRLMRAIDDRLRPLPRLRDRHPEIPPRSKP